MAFDTYVTKPVTQEVREAVETLLELSSFDDGSRRLFTTSREITAPEDEKRTAKLDDSDTYQLLLDRREELEADLDAAVDGMDAGDIEAASATSDSSFRHALFIQSWR